MTMAYPSSNGAVGTSQTHSDKMPAEEAKQAFRIKLHHVAALQDKMSEILRDIASCHDRQTDEFYNAIGLLERIGNQNNIQQNFINSLVSSVRHKERVDER
jgi:hypothetical protein